jgi:transcriptional regulator with XRE-family HTH domain
MTTDGGESLPAPLSFSDAVIERVKQARKRRGWTLATFAERCAATGAPQFTRPILANIETGRRSRGVTVDEVVALAFALDLSPLHLMGLPDDAAPGTAVAINELHQVDDADAIRRWLRGEQALPGIDERFYFAASLEQTPAPDAKQTMADYAKAVLQDRTAEILGQFHAEAEWLTQQAGKRLQDLIGEAEKAMASGADQQEILRLLRSHRDDPAQ